MRLWWRSSSSKFVQALLLVCVCVMHHPLCALNNASKPCLFSGYNSVYCSAQTTTTTNNQQQWRDNSQAQWTFKLVFHVLVHPQRECDYMSNSLFSFITAEIKKKLKASWLHTINVQSKVGWYLIVCYLLVKEFPQR